MLPLTGPQSPWLPGLMYTYEGWLPLVAQVLGKGPAGREEVGGGRWNALQRTASTQHLLPNGRRRVFPCTLTGRQRRPVGNKADRQATQATGSAPYASAHAYTSAALLKPCAHLTGCCCSAIL